MDQSQNFYVILELDPAVDDWPTIETRILEKQREWSKQKNQGSPRQQKMAARHLKLIKQISEELRNPDQRREHAREAQAHTQEADRVRLERLDGLIRMLTLGKSGEISAKEVESLHKTVHKDFTEQEIITRLASKGFRVVSQTAPQKKQAVKPKLDQTIAGEIRRDLQFAGERSLYTFLGSTLTPRSSAVSLREAADQEYKRIKRLGKTDPMSTARQRLTGHAMSVFKDEDQKERYDNSLADEVMIGLKDHIEVAGLDKVINVEETETLIKLARAEGVSAEQVREYLEEYARKRKWDFRGDLETKAEQLPLCGFCNRVAEQQNQLRCPHCGEELIQPCPRCGNPTPTQNDSCIKCGCRTGDGPYVDHLLKEGQHLALSGSYAEAISHFDRALLCWDGWKPAVEARAKAEAERSKREDALERVERLVTARKLEQARRELDSFVRSYGQFGTESLDARITDGVARAQRAFEEAERRQRSGDVDRAFDLYAEALGRCADFEPARRAIARIPPPAPAALQGRVVGTSVRLSWTAVKARGEITYRVVRKAEGLPTRCDDGTILGEVSGEQLDDTSPDVGVPWYYALYTVRASVVSERSAGAGPVVRTAELDGLEVHPGDGQVSLRWRRLPGCTKVEVYRAEGKAPRRPVEGRKIPTTADGAVDAQLVNGKTYGYLIVVVFPHPSAAGGEVRTTGLQVTATPISAPPAIEDLSARREGDSVVLRWTPPARGAHTQIYRMTQQPTYAPGQLISLSSSGISGDPVNLTSAGTTRTLLGARGRVWFVPLSVVGDTAVVGRPAVVTALDEVTGLRSQQDGTNIILTWDWPTGASEVLVCYRHDTFPTDPESRSSTRVRVTKAEYDRTGLWELRHANKTPHHFTLFVGDPASGLFSGGVNVLETMGHSTKVPYKVVVKRGWLRRSINEAWIELSCSDRSTLPKVLVVCKQRTPPLRPDDGQIIVEVPIVSFEAGVCRIPIPSQHFNCKGYIKIFFQDPENAQAIRLMPGPLEQLRLE